MTTLIVGCGYLGRRVASRLIERGERVLGTTRRESNADVLSSLGIEPVVLDVLAPSNVPEFDRLLYCVGFDRGAGETRRTVYVEGLSRFLEVVRGRRYRFVYASSTSVYAQDDGSWVDEDSPTEPRQESGLACLEAERVARGHGASVLRLAGLYGPGRIIRREALLAGEPIAAEPDKVVNFVQIDDAAAATVAALDLAEAGRIYNVADDRPVSRLELYTTTSECLGVAPPRFEPAKGPGADEPNRRIANRRMKEELRVILRYPDVATGLPASIAEERV
jgi:nucleoside-diphosphate-sugar epimerase